jgi:hypothetical protein
LGEGKNLLEANGWWFGRMIANASQAVDSDARANRFLLHRIIIHTFHSPSLLSYQSASLL